MDGLWTLEMTPLSMRSWSTFFASFSKGRGTLLVYLFLLGVAPAMSSIFIGLQFIGFRLSSSLMMFLNSSSRRMVVVETALAFFALLHDSVREANGDAFQGP